MKKLVAFAAIIAAVSFSSCGNKSAESTEAVAESETTVEEVAPAATEETATEEVAPATTEETPATEATPEAAPAE